ncbi:hypothetical protein Pst134EA_019707 [Puccinia striiformis f. sp. tritici]|uniref:hypothetical protein n=1 Tax=Puccinia striiformis f. sp. tritici TaxID=168172 RepID=UPI0020076E1D|nr:hypothetical protein Pst134EA_019707 [Puccinia striiformis f. sp. tritici]KAH9449822.1 hypothetical protein Pst134EB_020632 [Puccinia striiformis f. sp. tritici]KAH9459562.1 hypothetical protein Pst134EA_019707 [Puccinia striiformis f. sp. tritici]KAI9610412.1 hypothetical protein H4Q26_006552 [Puccinia striiformis f. sp. tritici PST-130]KAI9619007.1 hypothetical protein KEM48_006478 [Puccinia striiformis f. sp. tritici PST-130]
MLLSFRLTALISLIIACSCSGDTYFKCDANVDALCVSDGPHKDTVTLKWAERLHPKKRNYVCRLDGVSACCKQGKFNIPFGSIYVRKSVFDLDCPAGQ